MRFTCEKYLLSLAVSTAGRAAASKSPVSALEGLLLEAGETGVRITGFDLKKGFIHRFHDLVKISLRIQLQHGSDPLGNILRTDHSNLFD